jgi:hypothetical protein
VGSTVWTFVVITSWTFISVSFGQNNARRPGELLDIAPTIVRLRVGFIGGAAEVGCGKPVTADGRGRPVFDHHVLA